MIHALVGLSSLSTLGVVGSFGGGPGGPISFELAASMANQLVEVGMGVCRVLALRP